MTRARKSKAVAAPADDLAVLFPDRTFTLGGEAVTVRELRFEEQMQHHHVLAPLADALAMLSPLDGEDTINQVLDILAAHWGSVRALVAVSCGRSEEWIAALDGEDGETLLLTWWTVNQGFFLRRMVRPALLRQAMHSAGVASSPSSSQPDTEEASSAATPPAS